MKSDESETTYERFSFKSLSLKRRRANAKSEVFSKFQTGKVTRLECHSNGTFFCTTFQLCSEKRRNNEQPERPRAESCGFIVITATVAVILNTARKWELAEQRISGEFASRMFCFAHREHCQSQVVFPARFFVCKSALDSCILLLCLLFTFYSHNFNDVLAKLISRWKVPHFEPLLRSRFLFHTPNFSQRRNSTRN